jgi:hypothetical protein
VHGLDQPHQFRVHNGQSDGLLMVQQLIEPALDAQTQAVLILVAHHPEVHRSFQVAFQFLFIPRVRPPLQRCLLKYFL